MIAANSKIMKIKYLKLKNWLWVTLGALFGINISCESNVACEYGAPEATYTVKGQVSNTDGVPVSGIQVKMDYSKDLTNDNIWGYSNTILTDSNGQYSISTIQFPNLDTMYLQFRDIDSTENGHYADTIVEVSFKEADFYGADGNWYQGAATITRNVQLRRVDGE